MYKFIMLIISVLCLCACDSGTNGIYRKDEDGIYIEDNISIKYSTNDKGLIDDISIDIFYDFVSSLEYMNFNINELKYDSEIDVSTLSYLSIDEIEKCGLDKEMPKFINIDSTDYYFDIEVCSFIEYMFVSKPASDVVIKDFLPVLKTDKKLFSNYNFNINPHVQNSVSVQFIKYSFMDDSWSKAEVLKVPMSFKQSQENEIESGKTLSNQLKLLETALLMIQEVEVFEYSNNTWSETIKELLGVNSDLVKYVNFDELECVIDVLHNLSSLLGVKNV